MIAVAEGRFVDSSPRGPLPPACTVAIATGGEIVVAGVGAESDPSPLPPGQFAVGAGVVGAGGLARLASSFSLVALQALGSKLLLRSALDLHVKWVSKLWWTQIPMLRARWMRFWGRGPLPRSLPSA